MGPDATTRMPGESSTLTSGEAIHPTRRAMLRFGLVGIAGLASLVAACGTTQQASSGAGTAAGAGGATGAGAGTTNSSAANSAKEAPAAKTLAPATLVWAYWGSQEQSDVRDEVIKGIQAKYPNITIDKMLNASGLDDHFAKVQVLVTSGSGLDLFMSSPVWVPNLAERSLYRSLDSLMARDKFPVKEWSDAALDAFAFRGKQFVLPEILNFAVVVYNQDLLDKAGEQAPSADWTWDDFVATAQRIKPRLGENTWAVGPVNADLNNTLPWIWSNGGKIFDNEQDPRQSTFNTAQTTEAVQWRADWAHRLGIAPKPSDITQPGDPFVNGMLAMSVTTLAGFPNLAKGITSFKWDVTRIPKGKAGRVNFVGSAGQGIASSSKAVDQAWQVLQYLGSKDALIPYMKSQWGVPPVISLAKQDYLQMPPPPANRRAVVDGIADLRPLPKVPVMLELYNQIYGAELKKIYAGERTARDAAVDIDTQVQAKLAAK